MTRRGVAWAPALPEHWSGASLRWLAEIYAGGTPDRENLGYWTNGTVPWLNSGAVNDWAITNPSELITEAGVAGSSARWVPAGAVVIGLAGQGKTKGTAARLEIPSTTNQSMAAMVPGPDLEYRFLHYWLVSNYQSIRNLAGGDKRDGLNLQHIASIEVPLPPLTEQCAIADYLDREIARIDTLIEEQQCLIEMLRGRRRAFIDRTVFGIDRSGHREVLCIGRHLAVERLLRVVPDHWSIKRFKVVLKRVDERNLALAEPMMSLKTTGEVVPRSSQQQPDPSSLPRYLVAHPGDLVVNPMWLTGGAIGVSDVSGAVSPDYRVFRSTGEHHPRFLHHLLRSSPYRDQYLLYTRAQTTFDRRVQQSDLNNMPLPVPPMDEQKRLAVAIDAGVEEIDVLIEETERFIQLSRERRSVLITAAVTGQIDVREMA